MSASPMTACQRQRMRALWRELPEEADPCIFCPAGEHFSKGEETPTGILPVLESQVAEYDVRRCSDCSSWLCSPSTCWYVFKPSRDSDCVFCSSACLRHFNVKQAELKQAGLPFRMRDPAASAEERWWWDSAAKDIKRRNMSHSAMVARQRMLEEQKVVVDLCSSDDEGL